MKQVGRSVAGVGLALLGMVLLGCPGPKPEDTAAPPKPGEPAKSAGGTLKVGVVLDQGGPDDKSFNAAANAGLQKAKSELAIDKEKSKYVESKTAADYKTNLTQLASAGYNVVFAIGYKMHDALTEVAPQFPDTKFIIVDGQAPDLPNCEALLFKEEQGSYLAGYLAGSVSKTKTIGFVGGEQIPLIVKFESGYKAGAMTADPKIKVLATYTGDWEDLNKGRSQADQQFANGADIIFQAAGKGGLGVINAARDKGAGFYAIGVDRDQDDEAPGRVLTSMVKRLDVAVFDTIKQVIDGKFEKGSHVFDLKEGGVGISELKYTKKDIPPDVLKKLDALSKMVADGKVTPPTTADELAKFQPPKIP